MSTELTIKKINKNGRSVSKNNAELKALVEGEREYIEPIDEGEEWIDEPALEGTTLEEWIEEGKREGWYDEELVREEKERILRDSEGELEDAFN